MGKIYMKSILLAFLMTSGLAISMAGCQKQDIEENEGNKVETSEAFTEAVESNENQTYADQNAAEINSTATEAFTGRIEVNMTQFASNGLAVYSECPFTYDGNEWQLQTLVPEDTLIDGELVMDDREHFMILVTSGENTYILFDDDVQLGMPEADVFTDEQNELHVVIRDVRTACYRVIDYIYDSEENKFIGGYIVKEEAVNFIGTVGFN